jgi:pyruvate/2-oxoacid:ferredoxin oxidoreductase alpha subunit
VDIPDAEAVDGFLPRREARRKLDPEDPHAFGGLTRPDVYMEFRLRQQEAMQQAREVFASIDEGWGKRFGRRYGSIEPYRMDGAETVLVTSGTVTSTARHVVNERRKKGEPVGLLKIKMFRPFPSDLLRETLSGIQRVAVLDRNISPGHGGIFAEEIRSALYDLPTGERPQLDGYVIGLGGRDVTPAVIEECLDRTTRGVARVSGLAAEDLWVGVTP